MPRQPAPRKPTLISVSVSRLAEAPDFLRVSVEDDGCGIQHHQLDAVFDRMCQLHPQALVSRNGLGLGLFICGEIVARLDVMLASLGQSRR